MLVRQNGKTASCVRRINERLMDMLYGGETDKIGYVVYVTYNIEHAKFIEDQFADTGAEKYLRALPAYKLKDFMASNKVFDVIVDASIFHNEKTQFSLIHDYEC